MTFQGTDWGDLAASLGYKSDYQMFYDLYLGNNLSLSQIAKKIGYSSATIDAQLRRLGLPKRTRGGANNIAKYKRLLHLMDQRYVYQQTSSQLAKLLGCHSSTVWKYKTAQRNVPINYDFDKE
jgi:DNA-binding CsgD family transcriptional regulator